MNPACVILVPAAQYIEPVCERGLRQLEAMGYPVWRVYGYAAIDVGRSHIATRALRQEFDELMWIDADIAFDPPAIDRQGPKPGHHPLRRRCRYVEVQEWKMGKDGRCHL